MPRKTMPDDDLCLKQRYEKFCASITKLYCTRRRGPCLARGCVSFCYYPWRGHEKSHTLATAPDDWYPKCRGAVQCIHEEFVPYWIVEQKPDGEEAMGL